MSEAGRKERRKTVSSVPSKGSGVLFWPGERMGNIFSPYFMTTNPQHFYALSTVAFSKIKYLS